MKNQKRIRDDEKQELLHIFKLLGRDGRLSFLENVCLLQSFYDLVYKKELKMADVVRYFLRQYIKRNENGYYCDVNFPVFAEKFLLDKNGITDYSIHIGTKGEPIQEAIEKVLTDGVDDETHKIACDFVEKNIFGFKNY